MEKQISRSPVVAVLGHVDHGKTSLLDKIRETNVAAKESGGITQHIGAYQIEYKGKKITFVDTPGHAAFAKMRSRGAQVADFVILVVSAEEGVQPQTLESLKFIQEAKVSYLIAINKIDLPTANVDLIKKQLADNSVYVEGYGGDIVFVPVSAKTGQGIPDLLDMILLMAEMQGLKNNPDGDLEAVVIESKMDAHRGPVIAAIVKNGTLKVGSEVAIDNISGKVRAMIDENGKSVETALPGRPVEILGFSSVPEVGGRIRSFSGRILPQAETSDTYRGVEKSQNASQDIHFKIILKADTVGTLEAIRYSLSPSVEVVKAEVGEVLESDVLFAKDFKSTIVAFRVKTTSGAKKLADSEKVKIGTFQVIYELIEKTDRAAKRLINPGMDEKILGKAQVLKEFEIDKRRIVGCRVTEGEMKKRDTLHLVRDEKIIGDCHLGSMKTGKVDIEIAKIGDEFGGVLSPNLDFKTGDVLVSFQFQDDTI